MEGIRLRDAPVSNVDRYITNVSNNGDHHPYYFSFGLIADMHYLDAENGRNFDGSKIRRFRQSFEMLTRAATSFEEEKTSVSIMMGDIVDGQAVKKGKHLDYLNQVLDITARRSEWLAVIGNHECYNFTREEMLSTIIPPPIQPSCSPKKLFYSMSPHPGYRFIVLDGYEVSTMRPISAEMGQRAIDIVTEKNHNFAAGSNDWFKDLPKENRRYVPFNGAVTEAQLQWLRAELTDAVSKGEKCCLFCHMALYVAASQEANLLWNCEEVLDCIYSSTPRGTVLACFAGHDHEGGYACDRHGIHHIVPPSPIECSEGEETWGRVEVCEEKLRIVWSGKRPDLNWPDELSITTAVS